MNRILHATSARRTEQEAQDVEAHFRAVVQNARDVILTIDESSEIRFANNAAKSVFGYHPEELEGEPLTVLMPERIRARYEKGLRRYLETENRQLDWSGVELPGLHRAGHEIPLSISFGEFTRDGERFFTGIIRDESERKEHKRALENARAFTEETLDVMGEIFLVCDENGSLLRWNRQLSVVTGYSDEDLRSIQHSELFADNDVAKIEEAIEKCLKTGETRVNADLLRENGEPIACRFRVHNLTDASGDVIGIAGTGLVTDERIDPEC